MWDKARSEEDMEGTRGWRGHQRVHLLRDLVVNKPGQSVHGRLEAWEKETADWGDDKDYSLAGAVSHNVHEMPFCPATLCQHDFI